MTGEHDLEDDPVEAEPQIVVMDTLIDVGGGCEVLIPAGRRIPASPAHLPCRPRNPEPPLGACA